MKPRTQDQVPQADMFRMELVNMIDMRHELVKLADVINWQQLEQAFEGLYCADNGRPAESIRLMCGLQYLKHMYQLSDEAVCERWVENPYHQYFCGMQYFQHDLPIDPSSMTRFRKRIGEEGCELLLSATVSAGVATKTVSKRSFSEVVIDSTVMEKAITYPTDAKLMNRCREHLVKLAETHGVKLRQSYKRNGKLQLLMVGRYARAKQFKRLRKATRKLKTYLGRVSRDITRKTADNAELVKLFEHKLSQAAQLLSQTRNSKNKLFSLHAPEVECIGKGKAHKAYEFGVKVGVVTTAKEQFVLATHALPGKPYDGHTLYQGLVAAKQSCGTLAKTVYVDRGYRGHEQGPVKVFIAGQKRGVTVHRKRRMRRRNAIEAIIGHMKTDGWLGRNHLLGKAGDAINALLCGAGQNLRKILRKLRLLLRCIQWQLLGLLYQQYRLRCATA